MKFNKFKREFKLDNFQMHKDNIEKLQKKVKQLLQMSSDEDEIDSFEKPAVRPNSQAETVKKCIELINENKQLRRELQREKTKNDKLVSDIKKEREKFHKVERDLSEQLKQYKSHHINKFEEQMTTRNTRTQMELQITKKKMKEMEEMLGAERRKCKKLANFIKKQLPSLQEQMAVLTGKMDAKLENYFLKDFRV